MYSYQSNLRLVRPMFALDVYSLVYNAGTGTADVVPLYTGLTASRESDRANMDRVFVLETGQVGQTTDVFYVDWHDVENKLPDDIDHDCILFIQPDLPTDPDAIRYQVVEVINLGRMDVELLIRARRLVGVVA